MTNLTKALTPKFNYLCHCHVPSFTSQIYVVCD